MNSAASRTTEGGHRPRIIVARPRIIRFDESQQPVRNATSSRDGQRIGSCSVGRRRRSADLKSISIHGRERRGRGRQLARPRFRRRRPPAPTATGRTRAPRQGWAGLGVTCRSAGRFGRGAGDVCGGGPRKGRGPRRSTSIASPVTRPGPGVCTYAADGDPTGSSGPDVWVAADAGC